VGNGGQPPNVALEAVVLDGFVVGGPSSAAADMRLTLGLAAEEVSRADAGQERVVVIGQRLALGGFDLPLAGLHRRLDGLDVRPWRDHSESGGR
jgi:hypothetical protein